MIDKIIVASHNAGKIAEIKSLLEPMNIEVLSASDLDLPDVEETGTTFEENARLKADEICKIVGLPCLADDSGLCVDALGGRPGVYSARYAPNRDFDKAMDMLIAEIKETSSDDWSAHFSCVLAFAIPKKETVVFEGKVEGKIIPQKEGTNGFGFDPIFVPNGFDKTFANFTKEEKAKVSHRGRAFSIFSEWLSIESKNL